MRTKIATCLLTLEILRRIWNAFKDYRLRRDLQRALTENHFSVGIVGAGVAGIAVAKRCRDYGIPFTIYEMGPDFGGTWRENVYPGVGCDVMSHSYSFSWSLNPDWSRKWAKGEEIQAYVQDVARKQLGLDRHTQFCTKVESAEFDGRCWNLRLVSTVSESPPSTARHRFLVGATGQLNIPNIPSTIKDRETFTGESFHSSRWKTDVELEGKVVACVGTGASAIQILPAICDRVKRLYVLQRSPGWVIRKPDYAYPAVIRWALRWIPGLMRLLRLYYFAWMDLMWYFIIPDSSPTPSKRNAFFVSQLKKMEFAEDVPKNLWDALVPKETFGCKRLLISNEWNPMFNKPNVELIHADGAVARVLPRGIEMSSGRRIEGVDVIIYATGFDTNSFLKGVSLVNENGREIHKDVWGETPQAYRGVTVAGFKNFGLLYGPNTNVNHSSVLALMEIGVEHLIKLVARAALEDANVEVKREAQQSYNEWEQARLKTTAFNGDCNSWYKKNSLHLIVNNWHGSVLGYWLATTNVKWEDYEVTRAGVNKSGKL